MTQPALPAACAERVHRLLQGKGRVLLGLAGPPGCGKSTLAQVLTAALPGQAVVVPMDGFHLSNQELARLGRSQRKGAPDTFDSAGFVALLQRLQVAVAGATIYAPEFRREIEEAIAGAIAVPGDIRLVIIEGNYLLLDSEPWSGLLELLDEVWYLDGDDDLRRQRLIQRHMQHGRSPQAAQDWVDGTDEPNARLIARVAQRAHWRVQWPAPQTINTTTCD